MQCNSNKAADLVELVEQKTREKAKHFLCQKNLKDSLKKLMGSALPLNAYICIARVIAVQQEKGHTNDNMAAIEQDIPLTYRSQTHKLLDYSICSYNRE